MASKIKGITVEIGGDTTKLSKALEDVNKDLKDTQGDLKRIDKLLKIDPSNVELLEQKQRALTDAISGTNQKLETLQTAADQAKEKLNLGEITQKQFDELQRAVIEAEQKLNDLKSQASDTASSLKKVNGSSEIAASSLDSMSDSSKDAARNISDAGDAVDDFSDKAKKMDDITGKISKGAGAVATAAMATVPATEDFRDAMGKLAVNTDEAGLSVDNVRNALSKMYGVTGDVESSVESLSDLMQTGFNDNQITASVDALAGAVVRFPDTLNIESLADSIQETVATGEATGQYAELLGRLGIKVDDYTASMEGTNEEQRKMLAVDTLLRSGLSETYDQWSANNTELTSYRESQLRLKESLGKLADAMTPLVNAVSDLTTKFLDWFNGMDDGKQRMVIALATMAFAFSPVMKAVNGAMDLFQSFGGLTDMVNGKALLLTGTLMAVVGTVGAVADAWSKMSGGEKVASVLGVVAAAAAACAVAMGAITGPVGAIAAAAAIAGGIGTALVAVHNANKRAQTSNSTMDAMKNYSTGGGGNYQSQQNGGYSGGGYQDQRMSRGGGQPFVLEMDGRKMARGMMPYMDEERKRIGTSFVGG